MGVNATHAIDSCPIGVAHSVPGMVEMAAVIQQVREEARRRGVRWTNQRQVIVETFIGSDDHLTVEELHKRVKALDATVSAATVYRTINMLVEIGVATKRHFGDGSATFESSLHKHHHDHLVCLSCSQITEFELQAIEDLQDQVATEHAFQLVHHRLELYGICKACSDKGVTVSSNGRIHYPAS